MPTLNWIGKDKVINHYRKVPFRILNHVYGFKDCAISDKDTSSGNVVIHGDNLDALKSLLPQYEGRINAVYIDPPYNTGKKDWVYNDNVDDPKIKKWIGEVVGPEGEDLCRHDKWLCMMYPRLSLISRLMSPQAKLAISIGYHELSLLTLLCKEIFPNKQIIPITVQTSGGKPSGGFNYLHEYVVFVVPLDFSPGIMEFCGGIIRSPFEGLTLSTFTKENRPNQVYPIFINKDNGIIAGVGASLQELIDSGAYLGEKKDFQYDYSIAPVGTVAIWPVTAKGKDCVWRQISSRLIEDWEKGYIKVSKNRNPKNSNEYSVQYLPSGVIKKIKKGELEIIGKEENAPTLRLGTNSTEGNAVPTIWLDKSFYTVNGTTLLKSIFPEKDKVFDYPKSLELIKNILLAISSPGDIILDSFGGSGTTAHAVMELNREEELERKFILIEMMDYANSVTAERIKRCISGYGESEDTLSGYDCAFDYYELGETLFNEEGYFRECISEDSIREYVYYTETRQPLNKARNDGSFLLNVYNNTGYYLYYSPNELTSLSLDTLNIVTEKAENYVIYADTCTLSEEFMLKNNIVFKKIPRDIKMF